MKLTILGTSCSIPTKERNTAGYFLEYKNYGILFDCGEGIQRQMKKADVKMSKITHIFLTHWHGDHALGLAGIIQTLGGLDDRESVELYGPCGSKDYFSHLCKSIAFDLRIRVNVHELSEGLALETDDFMIEAYAMKHRITCYAYRFMEKDIRRIDMEKVMALGLKGGAWLQKIQTGSSATVNKKTITPEQVSTLQCGRTFAYVTDTLMNKNLTLVSHNADTFLCECVYDNSYAPKAKKHGHLTSTEVGQIAALAGVKRLVLTHYSARYKDTQLLVDEVSKEFSGEVIASKDFMEIVL